jgi:hypothetical protein
MIANASVTNTAGTTRFNAMFDPVDMSCPVWFAADVLLE